jgi:hypothetical protein
MKQPTEIYEKGGVSVAELELTNKTVACYILVDEVEVIILNSFLPKEAKLRIIDFLLEKRNTETLHPIDFLITEEKPDVKGLVCQRV